MHPKGISSQAQGKFRDKELLLFDLDGTLIDSASDLALCVNFMLRSIGRDSCSEATIHTWVGNGATTLVKRALSGNEIVDENIDEGLFQKALSLFLEYYKENICVQTSMYEGVASTLEVLQQNYKLAIITNKPFEFIEPILQKLNIEQRFTLYIGGDSLPLKKPDPSPLLYVCEKLHVKPENAVMIGDSKNDILAASSANIDSIAVSYGYNYGEDISIYFPNVVIDNFCDILDLLD